jgi:hypothetical protein
MSALVWSVESAILSLWAIVFTLLFGGKFHVFIARSHATFSALNLVIQVVISARDLSFSHAASEAFVCGVFALFAVYLTALVDYKNNNYFSMSDLGFIIPLDACIGLAWFCAALVSAFGMVFSERKKTLLIFHHYGYHILVTMPSLLIIWLYNYDGGGVKWILGDNATHFILFVIYASIWGSFIAFQFMSQAIKLNMMVRWEDLTFVSGSRYFLSIGFKFFGRLGCVLIPFSATLVSKTYEHLIISWTLTAIAAANAIDWIDTFNSLFTKPEDPQPLQSAPIIAMDPAAVRWREKIV